MKMAGSHNQELLEIKKYPNRRFYDATRSCHVTLQEVYDLIREGYDVRISDSRTGSDITNTVLVQIILDRDLSKLEIFPSSILHMMLRSNLDVFRSSVERFFGPFMNLLASSQQQFDSYFRQSTKGAPTSPFDWANSLMQAFTPNSQTEPAPKPDVEPTNDLSGMEHPENTSSESLDELRAQLSDITARINSLSAQDDISNPKGD